VTLVAIGAVPHEVLHPLVLLGGSGLRVAISALEDCVIVRIGMTGGAHPVRIAVVDGEPGVIERGARPGSGRVASLAGSRETRRGVVRVGRALIVALMTRVTVSGDSRVVVVDVTVGTGNRGVCASQWEGRVVMVEGGVSPGHGVMAHVAGGRKPQGDMVHRTKRVVIVGLVARDTGRAAQLVVIVDVALRALQCGVGAGEGKAGGGVVELAVSPDHGVMATVASSGKTGCDVVHRADGIVVIGLVARDACGVGQLVVAVDVALGTGSCQVRARKCPASGRVIEFAIGPDYGVVAGVAGGGKAGLDVVDRVDSVVVVGLVARDAHCIGAGQVVVVVDMALRAGSGGVRPGKCPAGGRVIEFAVGPGYRVMAILAGGGESQLHMINGADRVVVVGLVTGNASRVGNGVVIVYVTLCARRSRMRAGQRKSRLGVIELCRGPGGSVMAALASLSEPLLNVVGIGSRLEILQMTADAGGVRQLVIAVDVALSALQTGMCTCQSPAGSGVVELAIDPSYRVMACFAGSRKSSLDVVHWAGCCVVVPEMAGNACRVGAGQVVVVVDVALGALQNGMRARQREANQAVIKLGIEPVIHAMALLACCWELAGCVVGIGRVLIILRVAGVTLGRDPHKLAHGGTFVAGFAIQGRVRSQQGKSV